MHFSAFVVTTSPPHFAEVVRDLEALPGLEVRNSDAGSGRLVAIHEGDCVESQKEMLLRIQNHPHVLVAGLFCHYHDPEIVADSSQCAASDSPRRQER